MVKFEAMVPVEARINGKQSMNLLCKVCGVKTQEHIDQMTVLGADMVGLNFYPKSARFVDPFSRFKSSGKPLVGVFVKATAVDILSAKDQFELSFAQLHGDEPPEFCKSIARYLPVIKVFRVDENFDFKSTREFEFCNLFLFDTRTKHWGGSGNKFNWERLSSYDGSVPFLLSGGIGPEDAQAVLDFSHPKYKGVDINSRFEEKPGYKDIEEVRKFCDYIKQKPHGVSGE